MPGKRRMRLRMIPSFNNICNTRIIKNRFCMKWRPLDRLIKGTGGSGRMTRRLYSTAFLAAVSMVAVSIAAANDSQNHVKIKIVPGGVVNIVNNSGSVTVHPGGGQQVVVNATTHSDKIEVDSNGMPDGRRVEIRTHVLSQQKLSADESKVEYDIAVPAGVSVTVSTATAPITVENLNSDLSLSSDTGRITVKNVVNTHIHVLSVASPVTLTNVTDAHVELTSS